MKWIFIAGLLVFIPAFTGLLRSNPKYLTWAALLIGGLPFFTAPYLYVAPISWAGWPGPIQGMEVSLLDGVALAVLFSTPATHIPITLKASIGIVALAIFISTIVGQQVMPALFYAWQVVRAVLLCVATARLCKSAAKAPLAIITGMGVALAYEAVLALYQYRSGDARPGGTLGHANFLGLASDFVLFPAFALLLGTRRTLAPAIFTAAGLLIALVGGSRATLGLSAFGMLVTVALSLRHRRTPRKSAFAAAAAMLLLAATPLFLAAVDRRTETDKVSSDQERAGMKLAATMMLADHPWGVGANQYVLVANAGGYSARAGLPWNPSERGAPVHDAYYLAAAELGYLGLGGLLAILASFIALGFRSLKRTTGDDAVELVPGLLTTAVIVAVHISFEWVFMNFVLHYLLGISVGLLVGIYGRTSGARSARGQVSAPLPVMQRQADAHA